jgi:PIN domain nuclease of toxin-antitoxin system
MVRLNLLVDTRVLIWFLGDSDQLSAGHYEKLEDPATRVFVSAISIFEMTTKARIGKLELPKMFQAKLTDIYPVFGFASLDVKPQHADLAGRLPGEHKDPFDRLLAAQSIIEDMAVMTIDRRIADMGARVVW